MSDFLELPREGGEDHNGQNRDPFSNPLLLRQYLVSMLGLPSSIGGPDSGRMGDYVFSQEALEQIMNQLMENGHKPVPLPDKDIEKLPRTPIGNDNPALGQDCQVCQDTFAVPDPSEGEKESGMLITVALPCNHAFHEDCIVPWLKQSGTCPVCRHALIKQPPPPTPRDSNFPGSGSAPGPSAGQGGEGGGRGNGNPSSSSSNSGSGSGSGSGGLFSHLFGLSNGSSSNREGSQREQGTGQRGPPGGWYSGDLD